MLCYFHVTVGYEWSLEQLFSSAPSGCKMNLPRFLSYYLNDAPPVPFSPALKGGLLQRKPHVKGFFMTDASSKKTYIIL